jgi:membrane-bound lytic murein transglycosylase A
MTKGRLVVARKLVFVLATSVAFGAVPQIARSTCGGNACNAPAVAGKSYGISQSKRARPPLEAKSNTSANSQPPQKSGTPAMPQKAATLPQCRSPCVADDASAKRADGCRRPCPQSNANQAASHQPNVHQATSHEASTHPAATRRITAPAPSGGGPFRIPGASLEPARWDDLDGWASDDHADAFATFRASCRPIVRAQLADNARPVRTALQAVCARALSAGALDRAAAREFFQKNFHPVRISRLGETVGFLTGYYEPVVDGSRFPTREFSVPIYRRPPDLLAAGATRPGGPFPNSGPAFRKTATGELVPYYDRGEIEDGALDGQHLEICWLRSASLAMLIGIEGAARVKLEDGTVLRVSYDAHNGYPFVPISRVLINRKIIPPEEMSPRRIREWMEANPEAARDVRRQNRSMTFFRIVGLTDEEETRGAQGIPLSVGRSIAVDSAVHVYGTPFFIEADLPLGGAPYRRTMIAQDTGSAIRGPARADIYFGSGEEAGQMAGRVRQPGRFTMLLPNDLAFEATAFVVPLPRPRPVIEARLNPSRPPMIAAGEKPGLQSGPRLRSTEARPRVLPRLPMTASSGNPGSKLGLRPTLTSLKSRNVLYRLASDSGAKGSRGAEPNRTNVVAQKHVGLTARCPPAPAASSCHASAR